MIDSNSAIGALRRRTAKRLRDNATDAENLLWRRLRRFPISSTHFRRLVATGPYVADFACVAARLIIEEKDGTRIDRPMSTVRRVTIEGNVIVIILKTGKIERIAMADVARMTIEPQ